MKKMIVCLLGLIVSFAMVSTTSAHVLITDETHTRGAILHIIPDDDPIAGQQATLYFDMQNQASTADGSVSLTIRGANGQIANVKTQTNGTLATATYTFPAQGAYELTFTVKPDGKTYTFKQSQRVSRGVAASALDKPTYVWAEILLLASVIGLVLLGITAFNHRKDIAKQSTF